MEINLIKNNGFENGFNSWIPLPTEAENQITLESSDIHTGTRCAKLSTTKAGQCRLHQTIEVMGGKAYTLSFWAKRTGLIDVWVMYSINGGAYIPLPSRRDEVTAIYQKIYQEIPVSGTGVVNLTIAIIAGSMAGTAWVDDVELWGEPTESDDNDDTMAEAELLYADVCKSEVRIRKEMSTSSDVLGYWPKGRLGIVKKTTDPNWYECRIRTTKASGNQDYDYMTGYIKTDCLENFRAAAYPYIPSDNYDDTERLVDVAEQEKSAQTSKKPMYYKKNIGTESAWCHFFADWLVAHCYWGDVAFLRTRIPFADNCGQGVQFFLREGEFYFVDSDEKKRIFENLPEYEGLVTSGELTSAETAFFPSEGDYVYFKKKESHPEDNVSSHVAIVIGRNYKQSITIAEGNVDTTNGVNTRTIAMSDFLNEGILGFGAPMVHGHG